jgi:release factor glutamine methyltransferase
MNPNQVKSILNEKLSKQFNPSEIHAFGFWILPHLESVVEALQPKEIDFICSELLSGKPIQYILEAAFFGHLTLKVNPSTLIPRPETEELCVLICEYYRNHQIATSNELKGIDIGTGSGCIPIYLLNKHPNWTFTAMDISDDALDIAAENAIHVGVNERLSLQVCDFLSLSSLPENLQLIVSNPPYITQSEKNAMHNNVLDHEPHVALFTPEADPLIFYRHIANLTKKSPRNPAEPLHIWLEINQYLGTETLDLFQFCDSAELLSDLSGNPRFIHAQY